MEQLGPPSIIFLQEATQTINSTFFCSEEEFIGSEPMNQTRTDRRPFALAYTHTETLTTVGLKHSFVKSEATTETNIQQIQDLSTGDSFVILNAFTLKTFVM